MIEYTGTFQYSSEFGGGVEVLYTYTEQSPIIDDVVIAYSYDDGEEETDSLIGCRAAATQLIANNLPLWTDIRKNADSTGQQLINSWGCQLEEANYLSQDYKKEQFLITANAWNDIHTSVTELSFNEEKVYTPRFSNILYNSSFSMRAPSRFQKPQGWAVERQQIDGVSLSTDSLFGTFCVVLDGAKGSSKIYQRREVNQNGGSLVCSVYYKTPASSLTQETYEASTAGLILNIQFSNGENASYGVGFLNNTLGKWVRTSFFASLPLEASLVEVIVVNNTAHKYFIDLPMLEPGKKPTQWSSMVNDKLTYISPISKGVTAVQAIVTSPDNYSTKKIELFELGSESEFKNTQIPTRIEVFSPKKNPKLFTNNSYGRMITYFEEIVPTEWVPSSGKVIQRSLIAPDVYGTYDFVDLIQNFKGELKIAEPDAEILATAIISNMMYAVAKETYLGRTAYYLKFVSPERPPNNETYLQSSGDLLLPLELGSSFGVNADEDEEVFRLGICNEYPGVIFIDTNYNRRFYFKLKYDYYYADFSRRKLFLRERYTEHGARLQVI